MISKFKYNAKFLILSFFLVLFASTFADAQSATSISRTCAGVNPSVKRAELRINKDGSITAIACAGKTVVLNGTTYTGSGSTVNFVDKETPSGAINNVNTVFTFAFTPIAGTEHIYRNGILQDVGAGNDYTISGATITFTTAPTTGDKIRGSYRR